MKKDRRKKITAEQVEFLLTQGFHVGLIRRLQHLSKRELNTALKTKQLPV